MNISKAKKLNQLNLEKHSGIRCYYSKSKTFVTLFLISSFILFFIIMGIKERSSTLFLFFSLIATLLLAVKVIDLLGKLTLKHPVFIINSHYLYYTETNTCYDLLDYQFENNLQGKYNFYSTFFVKGKDGTVILSENNWFLDDDKDLLSVIRVYKIRRIKKRIHPEGYKS